MPLDVARFQADEVFHFYLGDTVRRLHLYPDGMGHIVRIGSDLRAGARPQIVVPGGVWQGARLEPGTHGFALLGTTMSPGYHFQDFTAGSIRDLTLAYPAWCDVISLLVMDDR